ncbi:MAG TPA: DUF559 domain-containing protein [Polyangiales bacterium]
MARTAPSVDLSAGNEPAFTRIKPGRAVCQFASDPDVMHDRIESWAAASSPPYTLVTLEWEHAPRLAHGLDAAVIALARAANSIFPALYASARQREAAERWLDPRSEQAEIESAVQQAATQIKGVSLHAARKMLAACRAGELPMLHPLLPAEQVRQLALALDPKQLVIELLVSSPELPAPGCLFAFSRGAEWLARNSRARVLLVVPDQFAASDELDGVTYGALGTPDAVDRGRPANDNEAVAAPRRISRRAAVRRTESSQPIRSNTPRASTPNDARGRLEQPVVSVSAVLGKPHPGSEAELELHRRISADRELAPLFSFNQRIATQYGTTPRVDLVWMAGRLVIEVDGHRDHSRLGKFCHDRERDYELLVSGYRVLRVPEVRVVTDPTLMIEWIRKAVRYLQENRDGKPHT